MHLTFEPNLQFQQDAIQSITDLFIGQSLDDSIFQYNLNEAGQLNLINGVSNKLNLSSEQIFTNLTDIQTKNKIPLSTTLDSFNFTVEMETGTGKTYVYLRTIYELNKLYGFKKFVIVVPSIAIREGVLKNLEITRQHFQNLYENTPVHFQMYDSSKISTLRGFATNNNIEILIINIDSFAKDKNIINLQNDKLTGLKPISFIQSTNPIVIIDEPQNMETENRKKAIQDLNPLCTFRYSATHTNVYNLVYSLNPVKAYDLGLVKQIEVDSIIEENMFNEAFIAVESITPSKTKINAKLTIHCNEKQGVQKKTMTIKVGDDLYELSNHRELYKEGYIIEQIDAANQCINLSNGNTLYQGTNQGALTDEIMKMQIRKTIDEHLKKEKRFLKEGIKVLSLFFIDRVSNYRSYDALGNIIKGKFAIWFEEIYSQVIQKKEYCELKNIDIDKMHDGYFSADNKKKFKDTSGETKADDDTYNLIMRDKEKLLGLENPLRFIFSHSALREGWDNPNVFQICTLNETKSEIKKRQEIGRGLRLAVNQAGVRIYDPKINRLTVIANESYDDFAKALQKEIETDCGIEFTNRIKNTKNKKFVKYRKGYTLDPLFKEIWEKIKYRTSYRVNYSTSELIEKAAKAIKALERIKTPTIRSTKISIGMTTQGINTNYVSDDLIHYNSQKYNIPDVLGYIQNKTELTRKTILDILIKSGRLGDILVNPQLFLDLSVQDIKQTLHQVLIDGIKYQKIGGLEYEMRLFTEEDFEIYATEYTYNIKDSSKTIYENFIPLDSNTESQFAKDCETSDQIKFYFKLPNWFKIPTPIGNYNPDWAIVFEDDKKIYFVAETKDTGTSQINLSKLSIDEQIKIKCGKAHFNEFNDLVYKVVNKVNQLIE